MKFVGGGRSFASTLGVFHVNENGYRTRFDAFYEADVHLLCLIWTGKMPIVEEIDY